MIVAFIPISDAEVKACVDQLVTPENGDEQAAALIRLLNATADTDDRVKSDAFTVATRHAFTKTSAFEMAFKDFAKPLAVDAVSPTENVIDMLDTEV